MLLLKNTKSIVIGIISALVLSASALATPSTQIWIPSTDIQAAGTTHLGFDNYSTINATGATAGLAPSAGASNYYDFGVTYGAFSGLEIGVDFISTLIAPAELNIKYGIPEGTLPVAVAVGAYNVGFTKSPSATQYGNDMNIIYGLLAKSFDFGRISAGYYTANNTHPFFNTTAAFAVNGRNLENTGLLLSYDKQINDKWWAAVDYQGGYNYFGALSFGVSYAYAPNTSVIFGYNIYTLPAAAAGTMVTGGNTFTTQVDINI